MKSQKILVRVKHVSVDVIVKYQLLLLNQYETNYMNNRQKVDKNVVHFAKCLIHDGINAVNFNQSTD